VVFQDFRLLDHLTTYENVALPLRVIGRDEASYRGEVVELLRWVGLGERMHVLPPVLVGGEKQRAAIARALIARPELLLADEPTGNVDPTLARRLLRLFIELNKSGTSVVIATHDLALMDQFEDARRLVLGDPVPRLIVVKLDPRSRSISGLRLTLARGGAERDARRPRPLALAARHHGAGRRRGRRSRRCLLVFLRRGLAVAFATRGAVAANREVVDVLHFVGADDAFIAREFQRRFFRIGLKGGAVGGGLRAALPDPVRVPRRRWSATATGGQIEALFGNFDLGWQGYGSVVLVALVASVMTAIVSQVTVRRFLREPEPRSSR
jgi:hypothetical protein